MSVYWDMMIGLALPGWVDELGSPGFNTRMVQMILLLRPQGLERLQKLLAAAAGGPILLPTQRGWQPIRAASQIDILPKAEGWLRVCFDVHLDIIESANEDDLADMPLTPAAQATGAHHRAGAG